MQRFGRRAAPLEGAGAFTACGQSRVVRQTRAAAWMAGGDASTAVVYAPRRSSGPPARIWQTLPRKLEASQERPFRIEVQVVAREHATPASHLAALEAVRNAQPALTEAAGMCAEDLDRLLVGLVVRSASASKQRV